MTNGPIIGFGIAAGSLGVVFLGLFLAGIRRGALSRSWARTRGRIETFGYHYGLVSVTYHYEVEETAFQGQAIVPGPFFGKSAALALPKQAYLNPDGTLRFEPGSEVDVYYNPARPADAVLLPGIPPGNAKGFLWAGVVLTGIAVLYRFGLPADGLMLAAKAFLLISVVLACWAVKWGLRWRKTASFTTVHGRILEAGVEYSSSGEGGGGYAPTVEFEYEVNSRRYRSRQTSALQVSVAGSRERAQRQAEQWQREPDVRVYYDPEAPWDGFLRPGPLWGVALMLGLAAAFAAFGLLLLNR